MAKTDLSYGRLPAEHEDHFLVKAAQLVGTDALLTTRDNIEMVIAAKAMMCAYGPSGYGKTMAVNSALRALAPKTTYRLELRGGPTPRDIRHGLFHALRLPGEPPRRPIEFDTLLKEVLAEQFRVLVCDEAQWMSRTGFEYWRHLWDDRNTDIAIIFAGGDNCYKVLRREPMLASRIFIWQEFTRIPKTEIRPVVQAFHPIWATCDLELIDAIDAEAAHGSFRNWASITALLQEGMASTGTEHVNEELVHWVYSKIGGM
ncbi:AAA family ATPase [Streptomyces sp. NPDC020799]|uniref:ATP-binding protein n=1 Tax=Streptomyces TaxID=1883 RepID=UPI000E246988|nr:ATP-binding protein [Streptomyces olivoreticuli]